MRNLARLIQFDNTREVRRRVRRNHTIDERVLGESHADSQARRRAFGLVRARPQGSVCRSGLPTPGERPDAWSADGRSLWLFRRGEVRGLK